VNLRLIAAAALIAVLGVVLGRAVGGPLGLVAAIVTGILVAVLVERADVLRLRRLAERVDSWLGHGDRDPVVVPSGEGWRQLGVSLNALGAAYHRRGERLDRERPWRRRLVDSLVQPALLLSSEDRLLAANSAARDLLGIPVDATDVTVVQAVGSAALAEAVREVRAAGTPVTVDIERGDLDLRAVVSLVGDQILLIVADRTRERRVEELRRNFVVNASHELKTPVSSVQTLAEALSLTIGVDQERSAALVARLGGEAERLARLVHDLLDLRRLEERGPLERVPVDLPELIRLVVAEQVHRAESRGLRISVEAPDRALVAGVPGDLELIVKNLVSNAIQYNREGGEVVVGLESRDGTQVVTVRDTGIGIPQQDLARIFERFYRVDTARSRETGGTGLGLSIVRHAVERHGGTIRVDSLLGEGTTFTVVLPIGPSS
jgi:two-component system, OmpR family, sensor histidine kinase SenX3